MGRLKKDNVKKSKHSLNPDRTKAEASGNMRDRKTIKRLQMYRNYKPKRDQSGKIIRPAPFQSTLAPGSMSRIEPNRRWFGNTRVVTPQALQAFQDAMGEVKKDPYQVILKATKLPISLLNEKKKNPVRILDIESFEHTFGKKAQRKRPKLAFTDVSAMAQDVAERQDAYSAVRDADLAAHGAEAPRLEASEPMFRAGRSRRVWNELFKVVDSADVLLYVVDARDPLGTRSPYVERFLRTEAPHKHLVLVLNKIDLVPVRLTRAWKATLSAELPTVAFHAGDAKKPFGKGALIGLLRQFARLHAKDKQQISVGVIGFPNVGKSSVINALRGEKVCNVAPIAGETKVWQYVTLMRSIYLIDCPGVVHPDSPQQQQQAAEGGGEAEAELVLRGVVRVEYLRAPDMYIPAVLDRVKHDYLRAHYALPGTGAWPDAEAFLEALAVKSGKLLRGGEPDVVCAAKMVLNDFQRGRLPWFTAPPGLSLEELAGMQMPHEALLRRDSSKGKIPEEEQEKEEEKEEEEEGRSEEKDKTEDDEETGSGREGTEAAEEKEKKEEEEEEEEEKEKKEEEEEEERTAGPTTAFVPLQLPPKTDERRAPGAAEEESRRRKRPGGKVQRARHQQQPQQPQPRAQKQQRGKRRRGEEEEEPSGPRTTSKQRRRVEREQRDKKVGVHFYSWANVKNRRLADRLGQKRT